MRLNFGSVEFDAKGLPRIYSLRATPSYIDKRVNVSILLDSCQRSAVEKWAKRLGVEVVDREPYQARPGARWTHTYEAVREDADCRVRVWTSIDLDAPAVPIEPVAPADQSEDAGLPAIVAAAADPNTVVWVVDPKAAAECPCQCTATCCRCCDLETCTCGPACPVCDADGSA